MVDCDNITNSNSAATRLGGPDARTIAQSLLPKTAPLVSVLMPTYNYGRYLPEAIESVLDQDLTDLELLIADDASQDNSADVIASYAARDRRIRFTAHKSNLGMVQNWNWCLENARAEFVHFLFGDDKLAAVNALSRMYEAMGKQPNVLMTTSPRLIINEESAVIRLLEPLQAGIYSQDDVIARCIYRYGNVVGEPSAVMFRRQAAVRGFDASYRQAVDLEMWLHLLSNGSLLVLDEPLCCFRRHAEQQTQFNRAFAIGRQELARLFWSLRNAPVLKGTEGNHLLFRQIYEAKKTVKRCPKAELPEELFRALAPALYCLHWLRYKTVRPVQGVVSWCKKGRRAKANGQHVQPRKH